MVDQFSNWYAVVKQGDTVLQVGPKWATETGFIKWVNSCFDDVYTMWSNPGE